MGANCSSFTDIGTNEYLQKFCSPTGFTVNDPIWNQLLSFSCPLPRSSEDNRELLENTAELFQALRTNNPITGNLSALLRVFLMRSVELKASAQFDDSIFLWQSRNALFLLRCAFSHYFHCAKEQELIRQCKVRPLAGQGETEDELSNQSPLEILVVRVVELLVDVPLQDSSYSLHREAINVLLMLLSCPLAGQRANVSSIYKCLMMGKGAIHAGLLTKTLLTYFVYNPPPPKHEIGGSLVLGIASGIWNILSRSPKHEDTKLDIAPQALLLLLVLSNHCTTDPNLFNPYRQALLSFTDSKADPLEISPVHPAGCFGFDFDKLFTKLCSDPWNERGTLLLYHLLHQHQKFRYFVQSRSSAEDLVIPILKMLYVATESNSHHIYMSLIILLLLSEDDAYNMSVHERMIKDIEWYTERSLGDISLGGLLILVVVRVIQFNMFKAQDKYLHTNCLATLANMAAHFKRLHTYVCQKLVTLTTTLIKRYKRLLESAKSVELPEEELTQDLTVFEEVIRMLLEIINAAIMHQIAYNINLIYTLLYQRESLLVLKDQASFRDVVVNIEMALSFFALKLKTVQDPGVTEVLQLIQEGVADFPKERLKRFPELKFRYVEEEDPEEFFVPYVWALVCQSSNLHWNLGKLQDSSNGHPG